MHNSFHGVKTKVVVRKKKVVGQSEVHISLEWWGVEEEDGWVLEVYRKEI